MAGYLEHSRRWQEHKQPRRSVDFTSPNFQRPPDPVPDDTEETPDD